MAGSKHLDNLLGRLRDVEPPARDAAAAEIADLIDADQLSAQDLRTLVPELLNAALAELDPVARESMFNALSSAALLPRAEKMDWHAIADRLEEFEPDCLEHALLILGSSCDPIYLPRIESLLRHPDKDVRRDAVEAVKMLGGSLGKPQLKTSIR